MMFTHLSPEGEGGIGIFYLYGDRVQSVLSDLFQPSSGDVSWNREGLHYGWLTDDDDERVDEVVVRVVPENHSFTGCPTVELNTHSGPAILERIQRLLEDHGATNCSSKRLMERTEQQGDLDRIQKQAYESLLSTETRRGAVALSYQLQGELSKQMDNLRNLIASGEFNKDEVIEILNELINRGRSGLALTDPREVCILGPPNAGKSTLMNTLSREERSIVHEEAGTTRDVVQETIYVQGYPFRVRDTAGLQSSDDKIEREGIQKGKQVAETADLVIWMAKSMEEVTSPPDLSSGSPLIHVKNKEDLEPEPTYGYSDQQGVQVLHISAKENEGIDQLQKEILRAQKMTHNLTDQEPMPFREEHIQLLETVRDQVMNDSLDEAAESISEYLSIETN